MQSFALGSICLEVFAIFITKQACKWPLKNKENLLAAIAYIPEGNFDSKTALIHCSPELKTNLMSENICIFNINGCKYGLVGVFGK